MDASPQGGEPSGDREGASRTRPRSDACGPQSPRRRPCRSARSRCEDRRSAVSPFPLSNWSEASHNRSGGTPQRRGRERGPRSHVTDGDDRSTIATGTARDGDRCEGRASQTPPTRHRRSSAGWIGRVCPEGYLSGRSTRIILRRRGARVELSAPCWPDSWRRLGPSPAPRSPKADRAPSLRRGRPPPRRDRRRDAPIPSDRSGG